MTLSLSLSIISLFSLAAIHASDINLNVHQYSGLKKSEIRPIQNEYYFFKFCLCPKSIIEKQLPAMLSQCTCSENERGKQLRQSSPSAFFTRQNCVPGTIGCLKAAINNATLEGTSKLFVRVAIGPTPLTRPEFQQIPSKKSKNEALLKTSLNFQMRIMYSSKVNDGQTKKTTALAKNSDQSKNVLWRDEIMNTVNGGSNALFSDLENEKSIVLKKTEHVSTTDINKDVIHLSNMPLIKDYLFSKGRAEKFSPTSYDIPQLKEWIVTYHNMYRAKHNSPPLTTDSLLDNRGKRWADELAFHKACLVHEQPRVYGENLFFFGARHFPSPQVLAHAVVQSFYIEGIGYNYSSWKPRTFYKTGHFTQLVWEKSRKIGVGVTISKGNAVRSPCISSNPNVYLIWVVVKYDPAGNFDTRNEYLSNVKPPVA